MLHADFRHAIRSFARAPGFSLICILTLALGIGATTSIFSAVFHTLLRPLPFEDGDRMAYGWMQDSVSRMGISPAQVHVDAWRERSRLVERIEAYSPGEYTLLGGTEPEAVHGAQVSQGLPEMLGVAPVAGRTFASDELQQNGRNVVLISEAMSRKRYGGAGASIGKQIELSDGTKHEVVGVMPNVFAAFEGYGGNADVWFPLRRQAEETVLDMNPLLLVKEGVTFDQVQAELGVISAGVKSENRLLMDGKWAPILMVPSDMLAETAKNGLPVLFVAVCGVLLIACANIAGLLLVRLNSRRREIAIRSAIGARRALIVRLLGVEAFVLAIAGGSLGILLSTWMTAALREIRPENLNSLDAIRVDPFTLAFAVGVSLLTALFFGIAPTISALRRDLTDGLISGVGSSGRVTSSNRVRSVMVAGQIAVSLVLLIGCLVLVRNVQRLQSVDLGFDPTNTLTFELPLPDEAGYTDATREALLRSTVDGLRHLHGVTNVAVSTGTPNRISVMFGALEVKGRKLSTAEQTNIVEFTGATPEYVTTVGLRVREGRFFRENESGNPILINQSWARQLWPDGSALGHEIRLGGPDAEFFTIIGVVADVKGHGPASTGADAHLYMPFSYTHREASIEVRTSGVDPLSLAPHVRTIVKSSDSKALIRNMATMESLMSATIALDRFYMMLLGSFAALALVLSIVGLYGVISNTVVQRTREIGVRIALGATPSEVRSLVIRQGMGITGIGLAIGAIGAYYAVLTLKGTVHAFEPRDPVSFALAMTALAAGALVATYIPAKRAVRVDPLDALRSE